ncbi:1,4-dihydroxy-2-naphthoate octaprenyltransferase [Caldalkalibacillus uzonensis]|uniref:1,4-dihydroxy-2-naphthoate octaprenyltransferase n=1 Tax=Caldalkalibacillus uzonensis TaxID=353224 RepID=A0ABU0CNU9_9BACI|nr:tripartite tricarboxylate transporter TctB family protein [Caldalkalibacillus uzonensis]MDQ0338093.1 1,4-dihydroxy-2-naphthoate octaprenyltransferase [Caldalkalibacillus uzonensis]
MKILFSVILLIFSVLFFYQGLNYPYFTTGEQVGPGFFPRWIGGLLILVTIYNLYRDFKEIQAKEVEQESEQTYGRTMVGVILLTALFVMLLRPMGALLAMMIYIFSILLMFNRQRVAFNLVFSLAVPIGIYFVLNVWLNGGLPKGILSFL